MHNAVYGLYALILLFFASELRAAAPIWQDLTEARARSAVSAFERRFRADDDALRSRLAAAPPETSLDRSQRLQLPLPDGRLVDLVLIESSIMADEIAARYPEIKSYKVYGADDERLRGRLSISPGGMRGMLRTPEGRVFIDPENPAAQDQVYISRRRGDGPRTPFRCGVHDDQHRDLESWLGPKLRTASRVEGALLEYDLAVAVTREYYDYQATRLPDPDPDIDTMTAVNDTITRVNEIYEHDLGITLRLVSGAELFETGNDNLDNSNADALLPKVKDFINSRISGSSYDIGHMFSRPPFIGGGLAFLGGVCDNATKAGGVTGLPDPFGDPFDIDYVAHEIGHQFDAEHSFNGTTGSCKTGRWGPSAYEPGSGATIMGYANLCGTENLQDATAATFHAGSIAEIGRFTRGAGNCYVLRPTTPAGNDDPVISSLPNEKIPANTPFILGRENAATDPNPADIALLNYQWDQMDAGCPTSSSTFGTDNGSNALFRSYLPRAEGWRNFPTLDTQLNGLYDKAEVLPCQQRDLNFRLTARDTRSGQDTEDVRLRVDQNSGPFRVTSQATPQALIAGVAFTVTWDVANTRSAPVSCENVEIDLLAFNGGQNRYTIHTLVASTTNDGAEGVTLNPDTATLTFPSSARIRVKCRNNVFYDLSDADLTVTEISPNPATPLDDNDFPVYGSAKPGFTSTSAPACRAPVDCGLGKSTSSGSKGSSAVDWLWLLMLASVVTLLKGLRR